MNTLEQLQAHLNGSTKEYRPGHFYKEIAKKVVCADGASASIQASETHYCTPRSNQGPYTAVEVWVLDGTVTEFDYDDEEPSAYVPIEQVVQWIDNHGGFAK